MADITTHLDRLAKTVGPMGVAVLEEAKKEILALRQKWHLQHGEIERLRKALQPFACKCEGDWCENLRFNDDRAKCEHYIASAALEEKK